MSVNFGRAADPGYFVMGIALPLNRPVGPNRDEDDALPCYVVNALPGKPDRFSRNAIVSVHTFAKTTAEAKAAADDLDYLIRCTMPDDPITLPDGSTVHRPRGSTTATRTSSACTQRIPCRSASPKTARNTPSSVACPAIPLGHPTK
jgi:hypothetical protein